MFYVSSTRVLLTIGTLLKKIKKITEDAGETALHWVVERGAAKCCGLLIEAGSLVGQLSLPRFFGGVAPVHMACDLYELVITCHIRR